MTAQFGAFLSYSHLDDQQDRGFATKLRDRLSGEVRILTGRPFPVFMDSADILWGTAWEERIGEALAVSTFLLPILTPSFLASRECRREVERFVELQRERRQDALILPLYYVRVPDADTSADPLVRLLWSHQLVDWQDVRGAPEPVFDAQVRDLASRIVRRLESGERSAARVGAAERPASGSTGDRRPLTVISRPPDLVPSRFLDRTEVVRAVVDRLREPGRTVAVLTGAAGLGKTAVVGELLNRVRDDPGQIELDAFAYLAARGYRPVNAMTILDELSEALPAGAVRERLRTQQQDEGLPWLEKLDLILAALGGRRVLLVLDDADALLDARGRLSNHMLDGVVRGLAERSGHHVQLLLVSSTRPAFVLPGHSPPDAVVLGRGLPVEELGKFVAGLDPVGHGALAHASEEERQNLHARTDGWPRSIELALSVLWGDPSVPRLLGELAALGDLPAEAIGLFLLDRALGRLPTGDLRLLQAVAAFRRPVPGAAVTGMLGGDSIPDLRRLCAQRLIRQDGDRYYLPPHEAAHVLAQLERGAPADRYRVPMPHTQLALLHHAADHFRAEAGRAEVRRVDQLSLQFGEIDLRIEGEEYVRALEVMDEVDRRYLYGVGHSDALSEFRRRLEGRLGDPADEVKNLGALANARSQQEDHDGAIAAVRRAQARGDEIRDDQQRASYRRALLLMAARIHFDDGQVTQAHVEYEATLAISPARRERVREAQAHSGAALCLLEMGDFATAARRQDESLGLLRGRTGRDAERLGAQVLLQQGWTYLNVGDLQHALDRLSGAEVRARNLGYLDLAALCLDAQANALSDIDPQRALELAARAARTVSSLSGSSELIRGAYTTLALVNLRLGDNPAALAAADAATAFGLRSRGWGAYVIRGIARLRGRDPAGAEEDFTKARYRMMHTLTTENRNFQVHEYDGTAATGLALCTGDISLLHSAERAFRRARMLAPARGATRLCLQRLTVLLADSEDPEYNGVLAAAAGRLAAEGGSSLV